MRTMDALWEVDAARRREVPVQVLRRGSSRVLTFWSLDQAYLNQRLRYHLGQAFMLDVMSELARAGHDVRAVICDPDHMTIKLGTYGQWLKEMSVTSRFIELLGSPNIVVMRMSRVLRQAATEASLGFLELRDAIALEVFRLRDIMLRNQLDPDGEAALAAYRGHLPARQIDEALRPLAAALVKAFGLPEHLLLSTAYAFMYRPTWVGSQWLSEFTAYLAMDGGRQGQCVMMESRRNAYSLLAMECLFKMGRRRLGRRRGRWVWPTTVFVDAIPAVDGRSFMALHSPEGCLFLDEAPRRLEKLVAGLPVNVRRVYNRMVLGNQRAVAVTSGKWEATLLGVLADYRARLGELSGRTPDVRGARGANPSRPSFDVFLSYNAKDEVEVRKLDEDLQFNGIHTWYDKNEVPPGSAVTTVLEKQIGSIKSAAVFVGRTGLGPWQDLEVQSLLRRLVKRKCTVIPVILSTAPRRPRLPPFLGTLNYVDFREPASRPLERLVEGIRRAVGRS